MYARTGAAHRRHDVLPEGHTTGGAFRPRECRHGRPRRPGLAIAIAVTRLLQSNALERRVDTEAVGELAYVFDRFLPTLGDDIGCAELLRQRDPLGTPPKNDDLFRTEPARRDHAAQPDRSVADDRDGFARAGAGGAGRMVPVHITSVSVRRDGISRSSARPEERRASRRLEAHARLRPVRRRHCRSRIGRRSSRSCAGPADRTHSCHPTRGTARATRSPGFIVLTSSDVLDDADELVTHSSPGLARLHRLVRPQVAPTDARV